MADQRKCAHPQCHCRETKENGYCSDACARNESVGGRCSCGHPDCR